MLANFWWCDTCKGFPKKFLARVAKNLGARPGWKPLVYKGFRAGSHRVALSGPSIWPATSNGRGLGAHPLALHPNHGIASPFAEETSPVGSCAAPILLATKAPCPPPRRRFATPTFHHSAAPTCLPAAPTVQPIAVIVAAAGRCCCCRDRCVRRVHPRRPDPVFAVFIPAAPTCRHVQLVAALSVVFLHCGTILYGIGI